MSIGGPRLIRLTDPETLPDMLRSNGIDTDRPVVVCIGGAGGLSDEQSARLTAVFEDHLVPALDAQTVTVVDGGTDSGVMRLLGRARAAAGSVLPLIGVAAQGTVHLPGVGEVADHAAPLEPHHTHVVLVPGDAWGDETPWISAVATGISLNQKSVTLMVNGGAIALNDAQTSLDAGRPLIVLAGSGRSADEIVGARAGEDAGAQVKLIASSPLTVIADSENPLGLVEQISRALRVQ